MSLSPEELRQAMRHWATGVTIVTSQFEGMKHGMTVNSFTSVSLHPPLVLVSLERGTRTHGLVKSSGYFGVIILSEEQYTISDRFAGRSTEILDRFKGLQTFSLVSGAPMITGGLAYLDCRVINFHEVATHTIFLADVLAVQDGDPHTPLIYFHRGYWKLDHNEPIDS